jgi:hypothetical protein
LISGPSKTADIELTLAFGVHGPKELIVLIVDGEEAPGQGKEDENRNSEKNEQDNLRRNRRNKL